MTTELNISENNLIIENAHAAHHHHEGSLNPHLKLCLTKTLVEGLDKGREVIKEGVEASDLLDFLRELKGTLQKCYDIDSKKMTLTPQILQQFDELRLNPQNAAKKAVLDVIGMVPGKQVYTKEELDHIRESLNQDIEATGKRLDHAQQRGTEIYNLNMQVVQMLKAIVKGLDNAVSAPNRRIHR